MRLTHLLGNIPYNQVVTIAHYVTGATLIDQRTMSDIYHSNSADYASLTQYDVYRVEVGECHHDLIISVVERSGE